MHVGAQPRFHLLVARRLGPGVAARTQRGDEQRRRPSLAVVPVIDRYRRTGPIDKHLLARLVLLPQHHIEFGAPALVQLAEARVAIAIRGRLPIFLPQQLQGHILVAAQLLVNRGEVWRCARRLWLDGRSRRRWKHRRFHPRLIPVLWQRPAHPRRFGAFQVLVNRAHRDRATSPDLLVTQFEFESEAQDLP